MITLRDGKKIIGVLRAWDQVTISLPSLFAGVVANVSMLSAVRLAILAPPPNRPSEKSNAHESDIFGISQRISSYRILRSAYSREECTATFREASTSCAGRTCCCSEKS